MNRLVLIGIAFVLGACNPDTNGVYAKNTRPKPVKCVNETQYKIRCYTTGEANVKHR
jgi:hypothetical protein